MKRLLLTILSVIAFAGMGVAQDIYSVGYYTNTSGRQAAAVYKNETMLYTSNPSEGYSHDSPDVDYYGDNVYWVMNSRGSGSSGYYFNNAIIKKNDASYMATPAGSGSHIYDLWRSNNILFAAGCIDFGSVRTATVWQDASTTPHPLGNLVLESEARGITGVPMETLFVCGFQKVNSTFPQGLQGIIWKSSDNWNVEVLHAFDMGTDLYSIAYYNGYLYSVGYVYDEDSNVELKVWRTSASNGATDEVYTLDAGWQPSTTKIFVDEAGDIYVTGITTGSYLLYKNGIQIYNTSAAITSVAVNSNGVYYAGNSDNNGNGGSSNTQYGRIWKDGSLLYTPTSCSRINQMWIEEPSCNNSCFSLPFTEGFEMGSTDWPCWTTIDQDNNNGSQLSFWQRVGDRVSTPATGDYCAGHTFGPSGVAQEGWLISPRLFLQPGRDNTELTFKSYELYPNDYSYEGVWISTTGTNTSDFTQVWTQSSPSSTWKDVEIDLNEYQGQAIYIAFKYTGTYAHTWLIDDVSVTEEWSPCDTESVPYIYNFDNWNLQSTCWYVVDYDMSGGNKCWQYNTSEQCAYHPYGQSGVSQYGCLVSPYVNLPVGHSYVLRFKTKSTSSGSNMANKVWIKLDGSGVPNPATYTTKIWEDNQFSNLWIDVEVPLSSYAGHTISFSFEYSGTYAHNWYIKDMSVEESIAQYTITANANNNAWGTVTGGGAYNSGATCTLTATPASGYEFLKWTKNGAVVSTNPSYSFTVTENASYTAVFGEPSVNYYTIATNVSPAGAGTVEGAGVYPQGATTYLTATPNMGWTFSHWNDGITTNPRSITVNGDATYTAHFLQQNYTITVAADPPQGGTVSGGGSYHYGDVATLTATANSGYQFQAWSDGSTQNPHPVTVTGNADYIAIFSEVGTTYYNVSANVRPDNAGSVAGTGAYPAGTTVTLTATANPGYTFSHWNDGITSNPRTVTVNSNLSFTANFLANTYTITVDANPSNGGTVTGGGSYHYGEIATLRATPNSGFTFVGWNDGSTELTHNVTVTGNATYTATFSQGTVTYYSVNLVCNSSEGSVEGGGFYPAGSTITIQAIPNEGYFFEKWSDESTRNPRQITVNSNITLAAFFKGTGVDEGELNPMTLYPNPAMESIHILGIEANSTIEIYNSLGERVRTVNAGPDQEIGVSDLASGLYLMRCGNRTLRFVKQQ